MADEFTLHAKPAVTEQALDPASLTPEQVDTRRYYTLDQLAAMPAGTLEELWLACPDRPFYEAALKRAVDDTFGENAVVSDLDRLTVIEECLLYYTGGHPDLPGSAPRIPTARRPDGSIKWFKVSDRIRERLEAGLPLQEEKPVERKRALSPRLAIGAAALGLALLCVAFSLIRNLAGGEERISQADLTATAVAAAASPRETPTPTLLALDDIDRPIEAGDDLRDYYPVLLEIVPAQGLPRVFPVQQREVEVAEWAFEQDPDVASAVLGLVVRPVLGIPYTAPNAGFLAALRPGDAIQLRMSTGQTLLFRVARSERVSRQEVSIFDQSRPGIALVLLQEAAADRLVVYGDYPAEQEAPGLEVDTGHRLLAEGVSAPLGRSASLTVVDSATSAVPPGWTYLLVDLHIQASEPFDTGALAFELVDALGGRYTPLAADPSITHYPPFHPARLEAGGSLQATIAFLLPGSAASPLLMVSAGGAQAHFALDATPLGALNASDLDVLVLGAETKGTASQPDALVVRARLFNPHAATITLTPADVRVIFSPVAPEDVFPVGPATQEGSGLLPLAIQGGQAQDVELRFDWNGEPFAGLQIGGYRFILRLR
jgi:hypothetical protein